MGALQSRADAVVAGHARFQGELCKYGHRGVRYTKGGKCVDCTLSASALRQKNNRALINEQARVRYAANPEARRFRLYANREARAERHQEIVRRWHEEHPSYWREWYTQNAERERAKIKAKRTRDNSNFIAHSHSRRARARNAEGAYSGEDLRKIRAAQRDRCAYCREKLNGKGQVDHIIPLAGGGSNWPRNLQLLCKACNSSKRDRQPIDYSRSLGLLL